MSVGPDVRRVFCDADILELYERRELPALEGAPHPGSWLSEVEIIARSPEFSGRKEDGVHRAYVGVCGRRPGQELDGYSFLNNCEPQFAGLVLRTRPSGIRPEECLIGHGESLEWICARLKDHLVWTVGMRYAEADALLFDPQPIYAALRRAR